MQNSPRNLGATDNDTILLVDDADVLVGTAPKLDAHRRGLKHRAVSALVRNSTRHDAAAATRRRQISFGGALDQRLLQPSAAGRKQRRRSKPAAV